MSPFSLSSVLLRAGYIIFGLLFVMNVQAGTFTNASTALTAPATSSTGNYTVSFKTEACGTHYLQQKINSGSWTNIVSYVTSSNANDYQTVKTRNVSRSGQANSTYTYRVKFVPCAGSPLGTDPMFSNTKVTVVTLIPGVPSSITEPASDYDGAFTVSWASSSGSPASYKLEQQFNGGSWSQVYSGTALSKALSGLPDGTYKYRVRACNASGCSSYRTAGNVTIVVRTPGIPPSITITEL